MFGIAEETIEDLEGLAGGADADTLDGERALRLFALAVRGERAAAVLKTVAVRRIEETRAWKRSGHRTMGEWLAAASGSTVGEAIGLVETAKHLEELPETEAAFRAGELSATQVREVTAAAVEAPETERSLLEAAQVETVKTLRRRCQAVKAAAGAEDEERARDERIHRERYLRRWLDGDGALCLSGRMTADAGARLFATIDAHVERLAKAAANDGVLERHDAFAADALVALADPGERTAAAVQLTVDAARLRHDRDAAGETCHIAGIGEVSVPAAERLLDHAVLSTIVRDGVDVTTITRPGRRRSVAVEQAVAARDPMCDVPRCDNTHHLEFDHIVTVADGGCTSVDGLARLCDWHHFLKTHRGYRLGGGPGQWTWQPPARTEPERAPP